MSNPIRINLLRIIGLYGLLNHLGNTNCLLVEQSTKEQRISISKPESRDDLSRHPFLEQIGVELKRSERYRIFMSLVAVDLSFARKLLGEETPGFIERIGELTQSNIRVCDVASVVGKSCLIMLLPETSRQGAEVSGRRLAEMIQGELSLASKQEVSDVIPMEMASYPDAAGTKTVANFLENLIVKSEN